MAPKRISRSGQESSYLTRRRHSVRKVLRHRLDDAPASQGEVTGQVVPALAGQLDPTVETLHDERAQVPHIIVAMIVHAMPIRETPGRSESRNVSGRCAGRGRASLRLGGRMQYAISVPTSAGNRRSPLATPQ